MSDAILFIFGAFVTLLAVGPLLVAGLTGRDDND